MLFRTEIRKPPHISGTTPERDVQAPGTAFSLINALHFVLFCGTFWTAWIKIHRSTDLIESGSDLDPETGKRGS
jgi:hypothetical protein